MRFSTSHLPVAFVLLHGVTAVPQAQPPPPSTDISSRVGPSTSETSVTPATTSTSVSPISSKVSSSSTVVTSSTVAPNTTVTSSTFMPNNTVTPSSFMPNSTVTSSSFMPNTTIISSTVRPNTTIVTSTKTHNSSTVGPTSSIVTLTSSVVPNTTVTSTWTRPANTSTSASGGPVVPSSSAQPTVHPVPTPPSCPSGNCPACPTTTSTPPGPGMFLPATYDRTFDNPTGSLNSVACSNGANGLITRFATFKDIPSYPNIGGAFSVMWNSTNCGSCWKLTYPETGVSVNVTIIDAAAPGFNVAQETLDALTFGKAVAMGKASVQAVQMPVSACGL